MITVSKLIVIEVGEGDFERGFPVVLRISETGKTHRVEFRGHFPPAPEIPQLYERWQTAYYRWGENYRWWRILRLDFPAQTTNVSDWDDCSDAAEALKTGLYHWFDCPQMRDLRERILEEVGEDEPARLILQTQDPNLRRLPWHLWQLLDYRTQVEIIISAQHAQTFKRLHNPVRILAILGSSKGIDIQADRVMLDSLPNAVVKFLPEPSREELSDRLFEQSWDILFFAGHSHSEGNGETGYLWINEIDCLSPNELKYAIGRAVKNGLQLAIFNSCDGLGLARELADLRIPHLIVMREPVPDPVAQAFLKYFLKTFSEGESFYLSVRKAREQLHSFEKNYPCASWLPAICQNPAAPDLNYPRWNWRKPAKLAVQVVIALGVIALGAWVGHQENQQFKQRIELEQQGVRALQKFESQQLEALVEAMEAGQGLKRLVKNERRLEKYPAVSPILALQTILDNIYERNQLPEQEHIWTYLNSKGTHIVTSSIFKGGVKVWDISGQLVTELKGPKKRLRVPHHSPGFSPDGTRILTASKDGKTQIWDISGNLLIELKGHQEEVNTASFSPDGRRIATASSSGSSLEDRIVKIWDISGQLLADLKAGKENSDFYLSVSFSPDSNRIVTTFTGHKERNSLVKVWDISGKLLAEMEHKKRVESVEFSPDSKRIVTAFWDGTVKVWDTSGQMLTELKAGKQNSSDNRTVASFSPDGTRIVTASWDSTVKLWDTSGKLIEEYPIFASGASFSPDGKEIVTFSNRDETVQIWRIEESRMLKPSSYYPKYPTEKLSGHQDGVERVDFSSDGKLLLVTFRDLDKDDRIDRIIKVWVSSDSFFHSKLLTTIHLGTLQFDISFNANRNRFVVLSPSSPPNYEVVKIWDFSDREADPINFLDYINFRKKDNTLKYSYQYFSYFVNSPNGQHILTVLNSSLREDHKKYDTDVSLWDLSGRPIAELKEHQISNSNRLSFDPIFSPDGKYIFLGTREDKTIRIWNLSGELIAKIEGERAVFSPDRKHIITMFADREIAKVWDLSGRLITEIQGYKSLILNAIFSPDGQHIITAHADNTGRVWNLSGKVITEIKKFTSHSFKNLDELRPQIGEYVLSFSPDGKRLFAESGGGTVRLWDLSGKLLTEKEYECGIRGARFSPDRQRILIVHGTGTAHVCNLSGKLLVELKGDQGKIFQASFSPDGQQIFTASDDGTVRLWDLSGRFLAERQMVKSQDTSSKLKSSFFSQDGKQIVTVFDQGTIRVWQIDRLLDDLLLRGCNWLKDYLATHPEARSKLKVCQQK